jgi:hypothetical protein
MSTTGGMRWACGVNWRALHNKPTERSSVKQGGRCPPTSAQVLSLTGTVA